MTSPHARSDCHADLSHIEWLSAPTIAAAPVLLIATAGTIVHQNERGSATRTVILTDYGMSPPQKHHASGNSVQLSKARYAQGSFETVGFKRHPLVSFCC